MSRGIIIHAEKTSIRPLSALSKKKRPIFSPAPIYSGTKKHEMKRVIKTEEVMRLVICSLFFCATAVDKSGTRAIPSEPVKAEGIKRNGSVIPNAIPYKAKASLVGIPLATSLIGIMIAIIGCTRLDATRTKVIGVEVFINSLA